MRAVVKNNIGVFNPQGFLDGNNTSSFFNLEDIKIAEQLQVEILLVSLKKVIFFNNNGISILVQLLLKMRSKNHALIGFCDYDTKKYETIKSFYKDNLVFSLFKTYNIATLFCASFNNQNKTALLYNDDPSQRSAMAIELFERGHNPVIAQTKEEFNEKAKTPENYYVIIEDTYLNLLGQKIATRVKGNAVIYTLSGFLDAEISDNFDIIYHQNSLHVGFRLFIFDTYQVVSMNIHAVNFFTKLSSSAAEYNAMICFAGMTFDKTPKQFKQDMEDFGILYFDSIDDIFKNDEILSSLKNNSSLKITNQSLSKLIVKQLPNFINAVASTMEMMTGTKAIKQSMAMQTLNISNKKTKFASSIGIYGAIEGIIILIFPIDVARKNCELLLGEKTDNNLEILDTLAEFVNIIGGRIKTLLNEHNVSVNITLPRTYSNIDDLLAVVGSKKGVQVNLGFDNDQFTFFLAR